MYCMKGTMDSDYFKSLKLAEILADPAYGVGKDVTMYGKIGKQGTRNDLLSIANGLDARTKLHTSAIIVASYRLIRRLGQRLLGTQDETMGRQV